LPRGLKFDGELNKLGPIVIGGPRRAQKGPQGGPLGSRRAIRVPM
jgi:hypothetical protein